MLAYDLSEMKGEDGSALYFEVEDRATELAVRMACIIESTSAYKRLAEELPSPRLSLYFQYLIKYEIYPFVRQGCVISWYKRNGKQISTEDAAVCVPKSGIFTALKECWDFKDIPITLISASILEMTAGFPSRITAYAKGAIKKIIERCVEFKRSHNFVLPDTKSAIIACHYAEGFDPLKRNDLTWYPKSGIYPGRVLIYFDSINHETGQPIDRKTIRQLEDQGFRWVALKKDIIEDNGYNYWNAPRGHKGLKKKMIQNRIEDWVLRVGGDLLGEVEYWRHFYNEFKVRINYISEEGQAKNIAQALAFDVDNKTDGFLVGRQRSEVFCPFKIGYHPKHIFFMWSKRAASYVDSRYDQIEKLVLIGYPYTILKKGQALNSVTYSQTLRSKGIKFIIALFDDVYFLHNPYSRGEMIKLYQEFLRWILENKAVGLIIKSKKSDTINSLSEIQSLLNEALESGRCIRLEDEYGRLPSDASIGADIAVGVGISTAAVEAVIGGCRGIHYDMLRLKKHEFYRWGYERIIFDDRERMIAAIKRYQENPENDPGLGDWSQYLEQLDVFCDNNGSERMGAYMNWLLGAFDKSMDREAAMEYADRLYAQRWGNDKIIEANNERKLKWTGIGK